MAKGWFTYNQLEFASYKLKSEYNTAIADLEKYFSNGFYFRRWSWLKFKFVTDVVYTYEQWRIVSCKYSIRLETMAEFPAHIRRCVYFLEDHYETSYRLDKHLEMCSRTSDKKLFLSDSEIYYYGDYIE